MERADSDNSNFINQDTNDKTVIFNKFVSMHNTIIIALILKQKRGRSYNKTLPLFLYATCIRLSLVKLLPSRAQLRFAGLNFYT